MINFDNEAIYLDEYIIDLNKKRSMVEEDGKYIDVYQKKFDDKNNKSSNIKTKNFKGKSF